MSKQITTLTFFRFPTLLDRVWAFFQMQFAHRFLRKTEGLVFYKLMGSGREIGFDPAPDWSVYALLSIWETEEKADDFFKNSAIFQQYKAHSSEQWTIFMKNRQTKGLWSGGNPFEISADLDEKNPLIAVVTRATIRPRRLHDFWKYVPTSQIPIAAGCEGLLFTKGIGEAPLVQMATFSLWKDFESVKKYAYQSPEHRVAIQKTIELDWYKEEMFARFQPYRSVGKWDGKELLVNFI